LETAKSRLIFTSISGAGGKQNLIILLNFLILFLILSGCAKVTETPLPSQEILTVLATGSPVPTREVMVVEYPPLNWSLNTQRIEATGCIGELSTSCSALIDLECDEVRSPRFFVNGLQPPYAIIECIHKEDEPADPTYFRQPAGLDTRYRSYAIHLDGTYRLLIKRSEFKDTFAPVESMDEALSYAMAMTGLEARFDLQSLDGVEYLVDELAETHVEETPEGYLVYLFDSDNKMGCDTHSFYAVKVLVTAEGDVEEAERQEIYRSYACFDFAGLTLDED
jgi:hypothetical protein